MLLALMGRAVRKGDGNQGYIHCFTNGRQTRGCDSCLQRVLTLLLPQFKGVISVKIDTFYLDCMNLPLDKAYSTLPRYGLLKRGCPDNLKNSLVFLFPNLFVWFSVDSTQQQPFFNLSTLVQVTHSPLKSGVLLGSSSQSRLPEARGWESL